MPMRWALKSEMRELPGDPGMETDFAYWIEELAAWIAEDEKEAETIRDAAGSDAKIILATDLS